MDSGGGGAGGGSVRRDKKKKHHKDKERDKSKKKVRACRLSEEMRVLELSLTYASLASCSRSTTLCARPIDARPAVCCAA